MTWHELGDPAHDPHQRGQVPRLGGRALRRHARTQGTQLPININEYAYNYHTSVPGQMIQWVSAHRGVEGRRRHRLLEHRRQPQRLRRAGQPRQRPVVAAQRLRPDDAATPSRSPRRGPTSATPCRASPPSTTTSSRPACCFGGASGDAHVALRQRRRRASSASTVHALVREIPLDRPARRLGPARRSSPSSTSPVAGRHRRRSTSATALPAAQRSRRRTRSSSPRARTRPPPAAATTLWQATYEAENAAHTGTGYIRNGPEGSPSDVGKFYTSGGYNVGGLRTGSDLALDFDVTVPQDGTYDLSVFANSLNTYAAVRRAGPDQRVPPRRRRGRAGAATCRWATSGSSGTTPTPRSTLTAGDHVITLAAQQPRRDRRHQGRRHHRQDRPVAAPTRRRPRRSTRPSTPRSTAAPPPTTPRTDVSGSGRGRRSRTGQSATFWVYSPDDGESTLAVDTARRRHGPSSRSTARAVDRRDSDDHGQGVPAPAASTRSPSTAQPAHCVVDRARASANTDGALEPTWYEAEDATLAGTAEAADLLPGHRRQGGHRHRRRPRQRQHPHLRRRQVAEGRHVRADRPLLQPGAVAGDALQPRPAGPPRRHLRQRRRAAARPVPAHLPREQLLGAHRAGPARRRAANTIAFASRNCRLRRRHLHLRHLPRRPAPIEVRPHPRQDRSDTPRQVTPPRE